MSESIDSSIIPTAAFIGASGSGRLALARAISVADIIRVNLADAEPDAVFPVHEGQENPVTRIVLCDLPRNGTLPEMIGGSGLARLLHAVHVLVWVPSCPGELSPEEQSLLSRVRDVCPGVPLLVAGSCADSVDAGSFDGRSFDPKSGNSDSEVKVNSWIRTLEQQTAGFRPVAVLPFAVMPDPLRSFNLTSVSDAIFNALPPAARLEWQCCSLVARDRGESAEKIILAATAIAGGIGVVPLPVADMPFIVTTQATLLLGLFRLYGRSLNSRTARSFALAALSAVAGPMLFSTLSKLVPGLGSIIGGAVAAACTWAVGEVAKSLLENGGEFELEDFKAAVKRVYREKIGEYSSH